MHFLALRILIGLLGVSDKIDNNNNNNNNNQAGPNSSLVLPSGLYQFMSNIEVTALLFESKWLLYPAFGSIPAPTTHPNPLTPAHPL